MDAEPRRSRLPSLGRCPVGPPWLGDGRPSSGLTRLALAGSPYLSREARPTARPPPICEARPTSPRLARYRPVRRVGGPCLAKRWWQPLPSEAVANG
ncbi:hypothetical protein NL676_034321 [Syzygium grande]|nr:hypothetical protein NL676_034321 [Syzygium grande]